MAATNIGFIGGGNMTRSILGGLVAKGTPSSAIQVSDPDAAQLAYLKDTFGIATSETNEAVARRSDVLVLAVKPQMLAEVTQALAPAVAEKQPLVLSIAAGIPLAKLQGWLGTDTALVRAMPNTPALVQSGVTAVIANDQASAAQRSQAESILCAVGMVLWLDDEALMNAVTAVSGSGPAYFFLVMEAIAAAGEKLGLSPETAQQLTLQTALGAAQLAITSDSTPAALRERVTSPGGTTEQALAVLEDKDLRASFEEALKAAHQRAQQLADG